MGDALNSSMISVCALCMLSAISASAANHSMYRNALRMMIGIKILHIAVKAAEELAAYLN